MALWTPAELASNKFWFKADELTGSNGSTIAALPDASGSGNHTTSTGTGLATVNDAFLNGMKTASFNGVAAWYGLPEGFLTGWTGGTAAFVTKTALARPSDVTKAAGPFGDFGTAIQRSLFPWVDGVVHENFMSNGQFSGIQLPGTGTNVERSNAFFTSHRIVVMISEAFRWQIYADGVLIYSYTALNRFAPNTTGSGTAVPKIGGTTRAGPTYFNGSLAEAIALNEGLSDANRQRTEGYLAHKWGLSGNLPSDHPYRHFAPLSDGEYGRIPGAGSWTPDFTGNVVAHLIGGGGGNSTNLAGGGAAYSRKTVAVTSGVPVSYFVGSGGSPETGVGTYDATNGQDTWFGSPSTALAKGGKGGNSVTWNHGAGGLASESIGDVKNSGGAGNGSRGGGAGGPDGAGQTGGLANNGLVFSWSPSSTAPGSGGLTGNTPTINSGTPYGGGGGAIGHTYAGGGGGQGVIVLEYQSETPTGPVDAYVTLMIF